MRPSQKKTAQNIIWQGFNPTPQRQRPTAPLPNCRERGFFVPSPQLGRVRVGSFPNIIWYRRILRRPHVYKTFYLKLINRICNSIRHYAFTTAQLFIKHLLEIHTRNIRHHAFGAFFQFFFGFFFYFLKGFVCCSHNQIL